MDEAVPPLELRPAQPGEGQALFDVTKAAITGLAAGHYAAALIENWMNGREVADYEQAITDGRVLVAMLGRHMLGFVDTVPGMITRLYVRPQAAGRGLGRILLERGVEAAGQDGFVLVEATLNAAPFYQRHGFVELGRSMHPQKQGGLSVEIVNMLLYKE